MAQWHNGTTTTLPFIWLRNIDPIGLHQETLERVFDLTTINIESLVPDVSGHSRVRSPYYS